MTNSIPANMLEKFTNFGDFLRFLRRRAGITQLELSIAVGYSDAQISRLEQNLRLPDIPTVEARFVPALDLRDEPAAVARLLDLAANVRREDAPAPGLSPYKGLNYFDEQDADLFVGREALVAELAGRVLSRLSTGVRFLAIVGASGSGKSSLVRAGLVPALRQDRASSSWPVHVLTPTAHPLESLALALTGETDSATSVSRIIDDLSGEPRSLHLLVRRILKSTCGPHLVLVIDQFEELFTLCRSETERAAFINNLLAAASVADGAVILILTLRADFYAHCADYPALREALAQRQAYIGAMNGEELRRAIEEPASRGRWEFEPGLVDLLLREVGQEPGALPLLSHALLETWQRRRGRTMTLSGYTSSGGVRGAIAETAEAVFADLFNPEQQEIARRIFLRLTELGDETASGDTRRRASLDELILTPGDADLTRAVLKVLADARLITTSERAVEVAHEALIREWPTLRGWLEDNREGLRIHRHLTEAAEEWTAHDRESDLLYRGGRLTQAQDWVQAHSADLNSSEREFLEASIEAREREAREREVNRQRELEAAQALAEAQRQRAEAEKQRAEEGAISAGQLRKRALYLSGAFIVALVMAFIALFFGAQARQTAVTAQVERRIASARELAAAALNNLSIDPERSILLALQAVSTTRSVDGTVLPEAKEALHRSLVASPVRMTLRGHNLWVYGVAFSPDGKRLAGVGRDGTVIIWDAGSGSEVMRLPGTTPLGDFRTAKRVSYSPDGRLLAVCDSNEVKIYEASTGALVRTLSGHQGELEALAYSRDGRLIATGSFDGKVRIWDAAAGSLLHELTAHTQPLESLALSPDGRWLATGGDDNSLKIWDTQTGDLVSDHHDFTSVVDGVAFSPDGSRLAFSADTGLYMWSFEPAADQGPAAITTTELFTIPGQTYAVFSPDGTQLATAEGSLAKLWDARTGKELLTFAGHGNWVMGVAFSPDGKHLASASMDETVRVWDIGPGKEGLALDAQGVLTAYSPDGRRIATSGGGPDGSAKLWDAKTGELELTLTGHDQQVLAVAFSPDGKRLASASEDATVIVHDTASGKNLLTLKGHEVGVRDVAFSPDGTRIATGGFDETARVWDAGTGQELLEIRNRGLVLGVAFSPDGTRLATSSTDASVRVWDVKTGQLLVTLAGFQNPSTDVAFSPDGTRIAAASHDQTARIWDAGTGAELLTLSGHTSSVLVVAFSPEGGRLATGSSDGTVKIWDVLTGQELETLPGGQGEVWSVAFSPEDGGAHLIVSSADMVTREYLLHDEELFALARSRVTRSLTPEECRRFLHLEQCPAD